MHGIFVGLQELCADEPAYGFYSSLPIVAMRVETIAEGVEETFCIDVGGELERAFYGCREGCAYGTAEMCFAGIECSECDVFWGDVYSRGLREEVWKYACEFVVSGEGE